MTEGQPNDPESNSDSNSNHDDPFDSSGDDESDCKLPARRKSQRLIQQHSQLSSNMPFDQSIMGEESGEEYDFPDVMDTLSLPCRYPSHEKYYPDDDEEVNVDNDDPSNDGSKMFYWNEPTVKDPTGRYAHLPPDLNPNLEDFLEDGETVALTNQNVIQPPPWMIVNMHNNQTSFMILVRSLNLLWMPLFINTQSAMNKLPLWSCMSCARMVVLPIASMMISLNCCTKIPNGK